jgi:hypothetical protein
MGARWVFGMNEHGEACLVHLAVPRFSARIARAGADPGEWMGRPGVLRVLRSGEELHHFDWMDPEPDGALLERVLDEAEDAWMRFSARCTCPGWDRE